MGSLVHFYQQFVGGSLHCSLRSDRQWPRFGQAEFQPLLSFDLSLVMSELDEAFQLDPPLHETQTSKSDGMDS